MKSTSSHPVVPTSVVTLAALVGLIWLPVVLNAQGLATDRPTFTVGATTLAKSSVQLEAGASLTDEGFFESVTIGEALVRYGVIERLELRVELPSYIIWNEIHDRSGREFEGMGDTRLGVKYAFGPIDDAGTLGIAVVGMLAIPTGEAPFTDDIWWPELVVTASKSVGESAGVFGQIFGAALPEDDVRITWGAALGSSATFGSLTVFAELGADVPDAVSETGLSLHTGLVYPVGAHFQIDVHGGIGLTDAAADSFIGAGLAAGI